MMNHLAMIVAFTFTFSIGCTDAAEDSPFKITTKRDNDKVDVTSAKDRVIVSIRSPFRISQAVVERKHEKWPGTMVLQMHLKGLEHFKFANGTVTLEGSVSSHGDKHPIRLWLDGKESLSLDATSPYWMTIRMVGKDGKPVETLPLVDGYFEMQLPKAFLKDNPKSITVNWIDFYR